MDALGIDRTPYSPRGLGRRPVPRVFLRHPLVAFVVLAYAFSWAWWLPMAVSGAVVEPGDGYPTHFPGLLGPMLAAFVVTAVTDGRDGCRRLLGKMVRWRVGWRWYAAVAAPLAAFALAVVISGLAGRGWPSVDDMEHFSGLPVMNLAAIFAVVVLVNGFGEEVGWRGFALGQLEQRHRSLTATLLLALIWAGWHAPLFWIVESFRGFSLVMLPGFLFTLACGAVVLTRVHNGSGGSILMVAVWHSTYNLATATDAGQGLVAGLVSAFVIAWAVLLMRADARAVEAGLPSPLAPTR